MSAPSAMPADNKSLSASEVDFMAQDVLIDVTPHRTLAAFPGLTGHFGPFQLGQRTPVPIWLALQLYKNGEAGISCPKWLDIEHLKHRLEDEKQFESTFSELPLHWYEVYSMLVRHAPEVLSQLEDLKAVVHDLQDLRQSKFKRGLSIITSDPDIAIRLRNIGAVELNRMRPLVAATMDAVHRLSVAQRRRVDHYRPEIGDAGGPAPLPLPSSTPAAQLHRLRREQHQQQAGSQETRARPSATNRATPFASVGASARPSSAMTDSTASQPPSSFASQLRRDRSAG
ncbi:MAG: hypothetical protein MHM6MM_001838 [Cercozoa sp. M6MM]